MKSNVEGLIVRLCSGGRRRRPRGCIVAQAGRQTCIAKADTTRRTLHVAHFIEKLKYCRLDPGISCSLRGSKLASGQIDGDGGDRVVGLLQHRAYSQSLKVAKRSIVHSRRLATRNLIRINPANPIFYSVDAAIKRAHVHHKTPPFHSRPDSLILFTRG